MHGSDDKTPWHRVVNAQGGCSTGRIVIPHDKQQRMLEHEGVQFNERGRCELKQYLWIPREANSRLKRERRRGALQVRKTPGGKMSTDPMDRQTTLRN